MAYSDFYCKVNLSHLILSLNCVLCLWKVPVLLKQQLNISSMKALSSVLYLS